MKAKTFTLLLFLAVFGVAQAQQNVPFVDMGPTVDGVIDTDDPWTEDGWVDQALNSGGSSTTDAASKFQLAHDGTAIYVAVMVTDATPHNEGTIANTYERDCVELFFHMSLEDVSDGTYGTYQDWTWQIRYQRDGDDGPFVDGNRTANLEADDAFAWAVTTDDAGWVLETALTIETLVNGYADWDSENFKFDIQTADNTTGAAGGRTQQMFWNNNSDDQWRDTQTFGACVLAEEVGVQSVKNEIGSVAVQNDLLNFKNVEGSVNIYSISGAMVKKATIDRNGSVDISSLKSGLYIVTNKEFTAKFVK
jgi:hypothetical protein